MEPENIRFGGGGDTLLHPLVAVAMVLAVLLILCLPRKHVVLPAFLALFLIPKGQQILFLGVHLNVYRIIILAGLGRWMVSRKSAPLAGGFSFMDKVCTAFFVSSFFTSMLLYMDPQAVVKISGDLLDALGGYFLMRFLIRDREDIRGTIKAFVVVGVVSAICMLNEQRTGTNLFGLLGGLPGETTRDGRVRSQAAFEVFITAGTYGAMLLPLVIWLWSQAKCRLYSVIGIFAATIMTITCFASTTLVAYTAGLFALFLWPIRKHMRIVRWGIVLLLVSLHLVMHGPVWSLIEKIDLTGSSSSYHRYMLIDNFFRHFSDWWLIGTKDNGSWGWDMWDVSNQYVAYAFSGGLLGFSLFIATISKSYSRLGTARKLIEGNRSEEWFLWCLGASMLAHLVGFLGINYMDQMQFAWLALLAIISVAVFEVTSSVVPKAEESTPDFDVYAGSNWHLQENIK